MAPIPLTYQPASGFSGGDSFSETVANGSNLATANVDITVTPLSPTATVPDSIMTTEGAIVAVSGISISDVNVGSGSVQVEFQVDNGTLTFASNSVVKNGNGMNVVTLIGTPRAINSLLAEGNGLRYTPSSGYSGSDT